MDKKMRDVTKEIEFGRSDDELLPITRCVCEHEYPLWEFSICIYRDDPYECKHCGRKLYWTSKVTVYCVNEDKIRENL